MSELPESFKTKAHHLALADEMFNRRARNGHDHPGHFRKKSVEQLLAVGLIQQTHCRDGRPHYYFTEAGYQWYLKQRPQQARKASV